MQLKEKCLLQCFSSSLGQDYVTVYPRDRVCLQERLVFKTAKTLPLEQRSNSRCY